MKIITKLSSAYFILLLLGSCNQSAPENQNSEETKSVCYLSVFEQDTCSMKLEFSDQKISGNLLMKYANGTSYNGVLTGIFKGDTILLNYDFKMGQVNKWHRNPIALLKRQDQLVMGVGEIVVRWGSGMFNKTIPINYDQSKFIFNVIDCSSSLK